MNFTPTAIPDVILIEPRVFGDDRGFFMETYQADQFAQAGILAAFIQDNHSGSRQGILRGLHYQIRQPQGKLVRAVVGEIFDVAVDLRRGSPTFGQWVGAYLSAQDRRQIWIPVGFAHGFYVVSDWAEVVYKATDYYAPEWERCLAWNDPQIGIDWPLQAGELPVISKKDAQGRLLADSELFD
ncbi:MAG TPA: dTDP-4-dehydrorhamnose 3,5-epimerase [Anaerolineaceae bacterium]|nr:dTDP-4-dehydrorhamnose 3,5-epimerase [Anaerolineaceae bacterium]